MAKSRDMHSPGLAFLILCWALLSPLQLPAQTNFTVLMRFTLATGAVPFGSLLATPDGFLYGTGDAEGISNSGTIFRIKQDGSGFAILKSFLGADGAGPQA